MRGGRRDNQGLRAIDCVPGTQHKPGTGGRLCMELGHRFITETLDINQRCLSDGMQRCGQGKCPPIPVSKAGMTCPDQQLDSQHVAFCPELELSGENSL